jgi:hypothetical protein
MEIKYFVYYDPESGDYKGFYTSDIWPDSNVYETPYIELTRDEWIEARGPIRYKVVNGVHTEVPLSTNEENEAQLILIKRQRDSLLLQSDWVVLPHSPITGSKLDEWITYRQALRDITNQTPPYTLPTPPQK